MSGAGDILHLIDDALTDYDVSPDAVRYGADPDVKTAYDDEITAMTGPRVAGSNVFDFDVTDEIRRLEGGPLWSTWVNLSWPISPTEWANATTTLTFTRIPRRLPEHADDITRCPTCRPHANPPPLPIDGHAYRRRTKSRR